MALHACCHTYTYIYMIVFMPPLVRTHVDSVAQDLFQRHISIVVHYKYQIEQLALGRLEHIYTSTDLAYAYIYACIHVILPIKLRFLMEQLYASYYILCTLLLLYRSSLLHFQLPWLALICQSVPLSTCSCMAESYYSYQLGNAECKNAAHT